MSGHNNWVDEDVFQARKYSSYEEYKKHQAAKLATLNLTGYEKKFHTHLSERVKNIEQLKRGTSVLCLGARTGIECKVFIDLGCFALGIDLNPGVNNKYVVTGDFHDIQFADSSVDVVYTNAFDHAFDFQRVISEAKRILKPNGLLIAEIVYGTKDKQSREPGEYESFWWNYSKDVIEKIQNLDFRLKAQQSFQYPWNGEQVLFFKG